LTQTKGNFAEKVIITLGFLENMYANFCCQKLSKIAENCDYNIDPWSHCLHATKVESFRARGRLLNRIKVHFAKVQFEVLA
jgi:hypothetical protein